MSKTNRAQLWSLVFVIGFTGVSARAQTVNQTGEVREFFNGVRSLAMGGASIAVVNDETALISNPAGLGKLRDFYGTIADPEIDASSSLVSKYLKQSFGNPFDPAQVQKTLDASRETPFHTRVQMFPSLVVRNFGIGLFIKSSMDAYMDATGANMQTYYVSDYALLLGYNLRLFDGRVKLGVVGKAISRIEIDKNLSTTGAMDIASNASEGGALGTDVGLTLTAPWTWLPTLSAVVRDVGGTNFTAGSGLRGITTTTRPAKVDQDIDVAFAFFPLHANRSRSSFTVELQKLKAYGLATDKQRYMHVGYEYNYSDLLFFRAGMNQRYWTAGMELASEKTQIQIASYGEDVGIDGTPIEDRRLIFKFSLRF